LAIDKSLCDKIITIKEKKPFRTYDDMEKYYEQPSGTIAQIVTYKRNPSKKLIKTMLMKDINSEWWFNDLKPVFRDVHKQVEENQTKIINNTLKNLVDSNKQLVETNAKIVGKLINYIDREDK